MLTPYGYVRTYPDRADDELVDVSYHIAGYFDVVDVFEKFFQGFGVGHFRIPFLDLNHFLKNYLLLLEVFLFYFYNLL